MRRLLLLLALVCASLAAPALYRALHPATRPPVVLITVDTLRPDAVGEHTPALHAFLGTARRFAGARTVAPLTVPAHASLFTGLLPGRHHLHDNVGPPLPDAGQRAFPLLAEELREAGYATAAFVAHGVLRPDAGLHGGFDEYASPGAQVESTGGYTQAPAQVDAALAWLERRDPARPWFLWVHLFDPHEPYQAFPGDEKRTRTREFDAARDLYHGEVRRVDAAIERLLAAVGPDAVVVLASDHGEGLGDHGEATHGALCYGSTADAFLAVRAPGYEPGSVDDGPRSLCDVAPSVRDLCGLPARDGDGRPLLGPPHEVVVTESVYVWRIHGWGQCFAATDGRFTLVESGPRVEFFDRASDPGERRPLPHHDAPEFERHDRALIAMRELRPPAGTQWESRADVVAYAAARRPFGAYLTRRENAARPDPKPLVKTWMRFTALPRAITFHLSRHDARGLEGMLEVLRGYVPEMAGSPMPHQYLASVHYELGRLTNDPSRYLAASREQRRAIELGHTLPEAFRLAAGYAALSGDEAELRAVLAAAAESGMVPDEACRAALDEARRALKRS